MKIRLLFPILQKCFKHKNLANTLNGIIQNLESSRSKSTIDNYRTALRSFLSYSKPEASLRSVNVNLIEGYQRWLKQKGVCLNTISCYMRSLRKLFHEAKLKDCDACFENVFTGNVQTEKRALPIEHIRRLKDLQLAGRTFLRMSRDLFLFSFYAMGMPFVDLAFLRKTQIKNGYIIYSRHKNGQPIRVKVEPPMQEIINMYAREDSPYLFPILRATEPNAAMREYETKLRRYNNNLKKLANVVGITSLSSYQVRHSWASLAFSQCTELPVISKALGHTNTQTTLIYIREINDSRVDEANISIIRIIYDAHSKHQKQIILPPETQKNKQNLKKNAKNIEKYLADSNNIPMFAPS